MHSAARFASSGTIVVPRLANPNAQPHPPMGVYVWACMCVLQARTVFQHAVRSQFQPGVHVVLYYRKAQRGRIAPQS